MREHFVCAAVTRFSFCVEFLVSKFGTMTPNTGVIHPHETDRCQELLTFPTHTYRDPRTEGNFVILLVHYLAEL
jgi:hypothetical protein